MNHKIIHNILLCVLLISSLILNGCGYKEIDKRFFVTMIGIDKAVDNENRFSVSLKIAIPNPEPELVAENFHFVVKESTMISDAINQISAEVDKDLDFGHTKIIVLGENLDDEDVKIVKDWLQRKIDIQNIAYISLGMPSVEDVLQLDIEWVRLPANALILAFGGEGEEGSESQYILAQYLFEFYKKIEEKGIDPILPIIDIKNDTFEIKRAAIYKDGNLKMIISPEETKYLHMFEHGINEGIFTTNYNNNQILMSIDKTDTSYTLKEDDENAYLTIDIQIKGKIEEFESAQVVNSKELSNMEKAMEGRISNKTMELLLKFQEKEIDPLGFGLVFRANNWEEFEKEWEDWQELYPNMKIKVNVEVDLKSPFMVQ